MPSSNRYFRMFAKNKALQFIIALPFLLLITFGASQFQAAERDSSLRLWFLDVGQGDSVLFDTNDGHQVLIDGGPNTSVLSQLSKAMPLTDKEIDLIIVSHNHADHLSGINAVLERYAVNEIWISGATYDSDTYRKFVVLVAEKKIKTTDVTAGQTFTVSGLTGISLYPLESFAARGSENPHDASVVTFWQYGSTTAVLMGDAESEHEDYMLGRGIVRHADILKVGHHGSNTSSSVPFLQAVSPKVAIISAGQDNRYGHPHQITLEHLQQLGIPVLRTDQSGTIRFDINPSGYSYKTGL
ncbi:MAG: ComEC/Rec2 family competence protein [bacterium]|nr:ComEC/Rec2 family competence protein [bacterium]